MTMKIISTLLLVFLITITNATKSEFKFEDYKLHNSGNIFTQMKSSNLLKAKLSLRSGAKSLLEVKTKQAPYPWYHIQARHSSLCMELDTLGGVNIRQMPCANIPNQKFMFLQTTFGTYIVMVLFSGMVLQETGPLNGDTLNQFALSGATIQQYLIAPVAGTCYFTIANSSSGKCVDVLGSGMGPGPVDIVQSSCLAGAFNQQWSLIPTF